MEINNRNNGFVRIATCSPELKPGNVDFNTNEIIRLIDETSAKGCSLLLTPEMSITGYSCGDLLYQQELLDSATDRLISIAKHTAKTQTAVVVGLPVRTGGRLFNCAAFVASGAILGIVPKVYLCNTNQYFEERWFASEVDRITEYIHIGDSEIPFGADLIFKNASSPEMKIGIEVCEDFWALVPPSSYQAMAGCNILLNLSASDEFVGKTQKRRRFIRTHSQRLIAAYVYSASGPWESSTDIVYSGQCIIAENGEIFEETTKYNFDTEYVYADIDYHLLNNRRITNNTFSATTPPHSFREIKFATKEMLTTHLARPVAKSPYLANDKSYKTKQLQDIFDMQVTALSRRMKQINAKKAVIGISGGVDSTLAFLVIHEAFDRMKLDKSGIIAVTMPGFGTTPKTKSNAEKLADSLDVKISVIPINQSVTVHFDEIGHSPETKDIVYENAQARQRTMILMDLANKHHGIVVGTGDLSELALGWCTYSGDQMSMYNVNAGIPKTIIQDEIRWLAETKMSQKPGEYLLSILNTPISPELLPPDEKGEISQKTENEIGPYELNDFFIYHCLINRFKPEKIMLLASVAFVNEYTNEEIEKWLRQFYNRFFSQQYKRTCSPDGPRIFDFSMSPRGDLKMPSDADPSLWLNKIKSDL